MSVEVAAPEQPQATPTRLRPREWAKRNLFSTWYNSVLTLVFGGALLWGMFALLRWVFFEADWEIIRVNLLLFLMGRFPRDQLWRPWVATGLIAVLIGVVAGVARATTGDRAAESGLPPPRPTTPQGWARRFWPVIGLVGVMLALTRTWIPAVLTVGCLGAGVGAYAIGLRLPAAIRRWTWLIALGLLVGIYLVLSGGGVGWEQWGGLHLNLFLTVAGILFAFPIGVLLALARRSTLPVVRTIAVGYIEFIRGVPLITLLFMAAFALGFLIPVNLRPGQVTRALIAITAFEAAYIAEIVRGGLQSVRRGQVEASQALGLPAWKTTRLIVLPQALRAVIPAMVGQFISLFKDTSLVTIIGLTDVLRVSTLATTQPDFLGRGLDVITLTFIALIFWTGSYTMSREARRLEKRLGVGER